jgi:hypothetical protein
MFVSVLCTDLSCKGERHAFLDVVSIERIHLVRVQVQTTMGDTVVVWVVSLSVGLGSTLGLIMSISCISVNK